MKNIALIHFSSSGHTTLRAEAVRRGAAAVPGVNVSTLRIESCDIAVAYGRRIAVTSLHFNE